MKALILILILLQGCTTYDVKRAPDGSVEVKVKSTRDLDQPELHYLRTGEDAEFDFKAAGVDNNIDAMAEIFASMMTMLQQLMLGVPND